MATVSARQVLATLTLVALAACAPATPPTPTAAPPRPTEAPAAKPTAAASPAARPTEKPTAKPAFDEQAVAEFYRGKALKMLVGTAAGGSYDVVTRLIAKHFAKYVPGSPTIVVENMPGANNMVAANHTYNVGPKDGTLVQAYVGSLIVRQLFGAAGVEYDVTRLNYLGAPMVDAYTLAVDRRAGFTRVEDFLGPNARQLVLGTLGPGSPQEIVPSLLREVLGANIKLVAGYTGGARINLAIESGEVQGQWTSWADPTTQNKVRAGEWDILLQATTGPKLKDLPNVRQLTELGRNDEERELFRLATAIPYEFARAYVLAPGVPEERVRALQQAFVRTMQDREFLEDAVKTQLAIEPVPADRLRQSILQFMSMPRSLQDKLKPFMYAP